MGLPFEENQLLSRHSPTFSILYSSSHIRITLHHPSPHTLRPTRKLRIVTKPCAIARDHSVYKFLNMLKCNFCWKELHREASYVTVCSHIFCEACSRATFRRELACPVCETKLGTKGAIFGTNLLLTSEKAVRRK